MDPANIKETAGRAMTLLMNFLSLLAFIKVFYDSLAETSVLI